MTIVETGHWIVVRRRVSLAGRVTGAGGNNASGGMLALAPAQPAQPAPTTRRPAARGAGQRRDTSSPKGFARQYETRIRADGYYFFLDLPAGDYALSGQDERGNVIEAKQVSIPPTGRLGKLPVLGGDLICLYPAVLGVDLICLANQAQTAEGRH